MNTQKRILAIHDLSGIGRCSLTVALPIISAMGIETSVLPTAILSTHTGGFSNFTYRDLTEDIIPILNHWKTLDLEFDGFYTGYLGSLEQIELVIKVITELKNHNSLVIVDPVMADHGILYQGFDKTFPSQMKKLCAISDVIIPNITEAVFLLGKEYKEGPYTKEYIEGIIRELGEINNKQVVLTGVHFDNDKLGAACLDVSKNTLEYVFNDKIDRSYHGTGDVFGSALTGALVLGFSLKKATEVAVNYTVDAIRKSRNAGITSQYGVRFETSLPLLIKSIEEHVE